MLTYEHLIQQLVVWGEAQPDLRAIIIIGSRARRDTPADQWSDLDLLLITTTPQRYLDTQDWLEPLGEYWLTFIEPTATGGGYERRVLFENALDVDFIPVPTTHIEQMLEHGVPPEAAGVLGRGMHFILDKDGMALRLHVPHTPPVIAFPPSQDAFMNLINDFWYHVVWITKKCLRGELWTALGGHAYMMHHALLPMLAWHAKARHGHTYETWHAGRFLESWADPRAVAVLPEVYSRYEQQDLHRALRTTAHLFSWLAQETAQQLKMPYPHEAEQQVIAWVESATAHGVAKEA